MDSNKSTSIETQKRIVFNFLDFLQEIKNQNAFDEDSIESIEVATQCLSSAFKIDLSDKTQQQQYSIKPHSFQSIFELGLNGTQKITDAVEQLVCLFQ
jgi:hypothetical protein